MELRETNGVVYYIFDSFERTGLARHCFTTRIGGVSEGCRASMNLWVRHEDDDNIPENYRRICDSVGFKVEDMVLSDQIHETKLYCPGIKDKGKGIVKESDIKGIDGFITDVPGVAMVTFYADCVPLFFLDPVRKVAALSHAGWKGTVKEIGVKTVMEMHQSYGCNFEDILAGIGPSIGPCCFEVDWPVAGNFIDTLPYSQDYIRQVCPEAQPSESKHILDLWEINKQSLIRAGIASDNIETAGICTKCNPELFFSHRNMGAQRGAMAAILELLEQ